MNPDHFCMGCMTEREGEGPRPHCGFNEQASPPAPHQLPLRTILNGKYLIGRVLGEGGFGITYLGWDLNLDLKLAVKEYYPAGFVTREITGTNSITPFTGDSLEFFTRGRDKFINEAKTLAKFYTLPGDVYALGCTFYHCITGKVPPESTQRMAEDDCAPPSRFCPDLPKAAERVLLKAMSVKAGNRYQNVGAFRKALEAAVSPEAKLGSTSPSVVTNTLVSPAGGKQSAGKRLAAYVIDSLILFGIFLLLYSAIHRITATQLMLFSWAVSFAYGFGFESSPLRATPGKHLFKLQVTDSGGDVLPTEKTALRNLIKFSPSLLYIFCPAAVALGWAAVDALALFFTSSGQTLHDCAAHARVGAPIAYRTSMVPIAEESAGPVSQTGVRCVSSLYQGTFFPLGESKLVIGRDPQTCNVIFPADTVGVSALHCELFWDRSTETVILKDLGSTYGTFVSDGRRLGPQQIAVLRKQDSFTIGDKNTFLITSA